MACRKTQKGKSQRETPDAGIGQQEEAWRRRLQGLRSFLISARVNREKHGRRARSRRYRFLRVRVRGIASEFLAGLRQGLENRENRQSREAGRQRAGRDSTRHGAEPSVSEHELEQKQHPSSRGSKEHRLGMAAESHEDEGHDGRGESARRLSSQPKETEREQRQGGENVGVWPPHECNDPVG